MRRATSVAVASGELVTAANRPEGARLVLAAASAVVSATIPSITAS